MYVTDYEAIFLGIAMTKKKLITYMYLPARRIISPESSHIGTHTSEKSTDLKQSSPWTHYKAKNNADYLALK